MNEFNESLIQDILELDDSTISNDSTFANFTFDDVTNPFEFESILDLDNHYNSFANKECNTLDFLEKRVKDKTSIESLKNNVMYVHLIYEDGSVLTLYTTLSNDILAQNFTSAKEGFLFDIKRYKYIKLYETCEKVLISKTDLYEKDEVVQFANLFI